MGPHNDTCTIYWTTTAALRLHTEMSVRRLDLRRWKEEKNNQVPYFLQISPPFNFGLSRGQKLQGANFRPLKLRNEKGEKLRI